MEATIDKESDHQGRMGWVVRSMTSENSKEEEGKKKGKSRSTVFNSVPAGSKVKPRSP